MTDNDRILCQVLEQQLSLRLREGCRDVLLHLLPAPLRGLLYIALRSSAAGYARMWAGTRKMESRRQQPRKAGHLRQEEVLCGRKRFCAAGWPDDGVKHVRPAFYET